MDLVARSGQNRLLHRYYSGGAWSAWTQPVNTVIASDPAITSWGPRRLDVFARSDHNELVHIYFNGSGWLAETLPGTITSGPEAVSWGTDVSMSSPAAAATSSCTGPTTGRPVPAARWDHRGGALSSDPTTTSYGSGRLDVFAADDKNRLVHLYYANATWSNWEVWSAENALSSAPDAVSWGPGRLDVVMRNANRQLGHVYYDNGTRSAETFGTWQLSGPPTIASWGSRRLEHLLPHQRRGRPVLPHA